MGLRITVIYTDEVWFECSIYVSNGVFAGAVDIYPEPGELMSLAAAIEGFPKSPEDVRTYEFSYRDGRFAGGYFALSFHCIDQAGHIVVQAELGHHCAPADLNGQRALESVRLLMSTDAASIDRFVDGLRGLGRDQSGEAILCSH